MMSKSVKRPVIIFVIGLVLALAAYMLTGILKEPTITQQDFNYTVTYQLDGETKTLEGVYNVRFVYTGKGTAPQERYYEGTYPSNPSEYHPAAHAIAQKDNLELCIVTIFSNEYLMGEPRDNYIYDPYLAIMDDQGMEYSLEEFPGAFDVELVSWDLPLPVENTFKFAGFSLLHAGSMLAMLGAGILLIIACLILVKRDKTVPYKVLDKISVVLNYIFAIAAIPFTALIALLMQIYVSGDELVYQVDLCVPAITAITVAASIALRRRGFTKPGFFIQFIGPVLFVLMMVLEKVLPV